MLKNQRFQHWMTGIDAGRVKSEGYDTVYAKGGADLHNDEYVVYDSLSMHNPLPYRSEKLNLIKRQRFIKPLV